MIRKEDAGNVRLAVCAVVGDDVSRIIQRFAGRGLAEVKADTCSKTKLEMTERALVTYRQRYVEIAPSAIILTH